MPTTPAPLRLPLYLKGTIILLGLVLVVLVVQWAWLLLAPLLVGTLLAVLLLPVQQWLRRWRVPNLLAIFLAVLLASTVLGLVLYFVYAQLSQLVRELPGLQARLVQLTHQIQTWVAGHWGISNAQQVSWLTQLAGEAARWVAHSVGAWSGWALGMGLIPIYALLLLYYRPLLVTFLVQVFAARSAGTPVMAVLHDTKFLLLRYVQGLVLEALIVTLLDAAGLWALGLEHALLLGVLGAVLNLIPYVGSIVATMVPMLLALATKDSLWYPAAVLALFVVVQLLDNELLVPRVVAARVKINALAAVLTVLLGNLIGGVAGMFLALPTLAVLKTIFDRVPALRPWGLLLGDQAAVVPRPKASIRSRWMRQRQPLAKV